MDLELKIYGATRYATLYANGRPVATFQRRRVNETGPLWRAFRYADGWLMHAFYRPMPAADMAKIVARKLGVV